MAEIALRFATAEDAGTLLDLVRELAIFEKAPDAVLATEADFRRHGFFDGGLDGPAPFARIRHGAGEGRQRRVLGERHCRQVEQPRANDTAAPPDLSDVRQI